MPLLLIYTQGGRLWLALTIVAMWWCVNFLWTGKLSWAPVLTSNGLVSEEEESEQMQMKALKGWFQQMMPIQWISLTHYMYGSGHHLLQKCQRHWFSPLLLWQISLFWPTPSPIVFLNHYYYFSMLSGGVTIFQFVLTLFQVGCSLMVGCSVSIVVVFSLHLGAKW